MASDTGDLARAVSRPVMARPARPGRPPAPGKPPRFRLSVLAMPVLLVVIGLVVAGLGQRAAMAASGAPHLVWALSPSSNTVTVRLTPGDGQASRQILARSHLTVSEDGHGRLRRHSPDGSVVRIHVPPGRQTDLLVRVQGPRPFRRTLTVTVPPALRVIASRRSHGGLLISLSSPLRRRAVLLCGTNNVSFPAPREVAVAASPHGCQANLRLTARDGERAVVPVTIPALPEIPLYSFASPAGGAIYITVDDGWTPSLRVLDIMRQTHLPVTAFLIEQAAQRDLPYWRAFVQAGGAIEDHTVSHPDLTKQTLSQATAQWGQARLMLGRWFGRAPLMGRPPYGAFNRAVQAAAYRGGLKALVGWSATIDDHDRVRTWDGKGLEPGEIVLLHWVPDLDRQLATLLAVIHAEHLRPMPLTPASFVGIAPQWRSLEGD
jgi:peptidoglycan/xylan/chitin deacetylase (PgdA/CDA1 family)